MLSNPAIVSQTAVQRLPRLALLLLCLAYILPGLIGRAPWKGADIRAFGYMLELAQGHGQWLAPQLLALLPEVDALLPYWLGAWAMQLAPNWLAGDLVVRLVFGLLLTLTLVACWYATYHLARSPQAQPVAFAFGGEAHPSDYARAMADGGLLALMACLGLAQLSHETTPALAQLCFTALLFYAFAALPQRTLLPLLAASTGLLGLTLSGAPTLALLLGVGGALLHWFDLGGETDSRRKATLVSLTLLCALAAGLASALALWRWRIELPAPNWSTWQRLLRLLSWFTWPAWPLALWTLWRWRRHWARWHRPSRHLALPLWFAGVALVATVSTRSADRSLLLALPALAALASFALPTMKRSITALIDWFTLLFFSGCAVIIWVVWIAMQTGVPAQPAANVARLAPGFVPGFSALPFAFALTATLAWAWLVRWRVGRNRSAIWKSLVLPAAGAILGWLLLMTLWLPLLDFARSYSLQMSRLPPLQNAGCVAVQGVHRGQIAALTYYRQLDLQRASAATACRWLIVGKESSSPLPSVALSAWSWQLTVPHPTDHDEDLNLYQAQGL